jgi:hypothetical protein
MDNLAAWEDESIIPIKNRKAKLMRFKRGRTPEEESICNDGKSWNDFQASSVWGSHYKLQERINDAQRL